MRLRSCLFALLVSCSNGGSRTEPPVAAPTPVEVAARVTAIPARPVVTSVTLPEIATPQLPIDQVAAPWTLTASDGSGLIATRVEAKAVVQGPLAFTELHLYFANPEDRTREGTFAITLPTGAVVSRFAMEQDGQFMEAEVVEKQLARRVYEDFLHRRQDPALMEKGEGNQFTARVFPIAAKSSKHVVLSFSQELPGERYVLPLRGLPKVSRLDVSLDVGNLDGTHTTQVLNERDWQPDRDFVSTAPAVAEAIASGEVVIAQVSPFDQATVAVDVPKAMTLLVDTSASRALGFARYASNVRELVSTLAGRYPGLAIEVVAFDQDTRSIYTGPAAGFGTAQVEALIARGAAGASDLSQALDKLANAKERLVIVTDGVVTAGAEGAALTAKIKGLAAHQVARVDVVISGGIRDHELATSLVTAGLPRTGAVLDLDQQLGEVASGLGERVLTDIAVKVPGATWVYPQVIKSARPRQRTMVYARLAAPAQTFDIEIGTLKRTVGSVGGTPALIERAAAAAEVADLEAKLVAAKPGDQKSLRAEIVRKAVAARVISSQTSMLVLESNRDYARYGIDRNGLADILVVGPHGIEQLHRTSKIALPERPPPAKQKITTTELALESQPPPPPGSQSVEHDKASVTRSRAPAMKADSDSDETFEAPKLAQREAPAHGSAASERDARMPAPAGGPPGEDAGGGDEEAWPPRDAPAPLKGKLAEIVRALKRGNVDAGLAKARAWHAAAPGDVLALIGLGEALEAAKDRTEASRIYGSIIDLFPGRADLRRFAGERLERIGEHARGLAVDTYRRAVEERPDHLSGHRLLAYALLRDGKHAEAFSAILAGLSRRYPEDRFAGGVRVLTDDAGLIAAAYVAAHPEVKAEVVAALAKHHTKLPTRPSTRFIMYWETDANDVDFHIQDARGGHAFYSSPELPSGGELYADITTGYGPECFAIQGRATAAPYRLSINYYSQGPMGYGMGLLQIVRHDGKGGLAFDDRPYVIMADQAYVNLGSYR